MILHLILWFYLLFLCGVVCSVKLSKNINIRKIDDTKTCNNIISNNNDKKLYDLILINGGKTKDNIFSISFWIKKIKSIIFGEKKNTIKVKTKETNIEIKEEKSKSAIKQTNNVGSESSGPNARLLREIKEFTTNPPSGCSLKVGKNIRQWIVTIKGAKDTIYEGEEYNLKMIFPKDYPSKPPTVYFLKPCPKHVHVYSNGDICLNLLGRDWRPGMTAESVAISILSMLSSAKEKKIPPDNALHSDNAPGMQQDNWMYHDDKC